MCCMIEWLLSFASFLVISLRDQYEMCHCAIHAYNYYFPEYDFIFKRILSQWTKVYNSIGVLKRFIAVDIDIVSCDSHMILCQYAAALSDDLMLFFILWQRSFFCTASY